MLLKTFYLAKFRSRKLNPLDGQHSFALRMLPDNQPNQSVSSECLLVVAEFYRSLTYYLIQLKIIFDLVAGRGYRNLHYSAP
ncbi:hypothetical protein ROLI_045510 (plasmid) [Roseobacter fucihabitans]|uniref:Uncharacterized protein n=1 Tax=Roseobacter fucihabitans TaxID=1537242 RepID=A0ABZ2BZC8_9RHOB|nr:hypothetical protein [Roseobacter litoralis]